MGEGVHHEASDSPNGGGDRKGNGSICKVWFGLVAVLVTNGGPAFIAKRFKEFLITNSLKHIISPPGHPSTNGKYH
jgi:transposase InsO family protein